MHPPTFEAALEKRGIKNGPAAARGYLLARDAEGEMGWRTGSPPRTRKSPPRPVVVATGQAADASRMVREMLQSAGSFSLGV